MTKKVVAKKADELEVFETAKAVLVKRREGLQVEYTKIDNQIQDLNNERDELDDEMDRIDVALNG